MSLKGLLRLELVATISGVWVDEHDAPEYLEMILNVSDGFTLRGRFEASEHPAANVPYLVYGELFFEVPAKEWTRTNVLISSLQLAEHLETVPKPPKFTIIRGVVREVSNDQATVQYTVFDEYESAQYPQRVTVSFKDNIKAVIAEGQGLSGHGVMHSIDEFELQEVVLC